MARLLISAAHTVEVPGVVFKDLKEAELTRKILKKAIPYLDKSGITYMPVPLDLPMPDRIAWINSTGYSEEQGDLFLEIHINDGYQIFDDDPLNPKLIEKRSGFEAWYSGDDIEGNKSKEFAEFVIEKVSRITGYKSQGAKSEYVHDFGNLQILNQTKPIATALECLYIDNPIEIPILKSEEGMDELAKAIVDAIVEFINKKAPAKKEDVKPEEQKTTAQPVTAPITPSPLPILPKPVLPTINKPVTNTTFKPTTMSNNLFDNDDFSDLGFSSPKPAASAGGNKALLMDKEERKDMINKIYKKVLGKEPNQSDLNYYINLGVTEEELIKKLVETPDHENLLKDSKGFKEANDKLKKIEIENNQNKAGLNDARAMLNNLNSLLNHKNAYIAHLQQELINKKILQPGEHVMSTANVKKNKAENNKQKVKKATKKEKTFIDFLTKLFGL